MTGYGLLLVLGGWLPLIVYALTTGRFPLAGIGAAVGIAWGVGAARRWSPGLMVFGLVLTAGVCIFAMQTGTPFLLCVLCFAFAFHSWDLLVVFRGLPSRSHPATRKLARRYGARACVFAIVGVGLVFLIRHVSIQLPFGIAFLGLIILLGFLRYLFRKQRLIVERTPPQAIHVNRRQHRKADGHRRPLEEFKRMLRRLSR